MGSFFLFVAASVSYCFSLIKTFIQGRFLCVLELPSSLLKEECEPDLIKSVIFSQTVVRRNLKWEAGVKNILSGPKMFLSSFHSNSISYSFFILAVKYVWLNLFPIA